MYSLYIFQRICWEGIKAINHKVLKYVKCLFKKLVIITQYFPAKCICFPLKKFSVLIFYCIPAKTRLSRFVFVCTCRNSHEIEIWSNVFYQRRSQKSFLFNQTVTCALHWSMMQYLIDVYSCFAKMYTGIWLLEMKSKNISRLFQVKNLALNYILDSISLMFYIYPKYNSSELYYSLFA